MGLVVFAIDQTRDYYYKKTTSPQTKSVKSKLSTRAGKTSLSESNRLFLENLGYNVIRSSV